MSRVAQVSTVSEKASVYRCCEKERLKSRLVGNPSMQTPWL